LENGAVSAALMEAGFRGSRTVKTDDVPLPPNRAERAGTITETLKRWKNEHAPAGVVIGLPLKNFSHHHIEMPSMNRPDMKKALQFELEKYLPIDVDEYVFDFISTPLDKGRASVLVFSVKKDLANEMARCAKEADLDILGIRASTVVSLCAFLDVAGEKDASGLFVNVTDSAFEIAALKNSMPVFLKGFPKDIDVAVEIERLLGLYPGRVYFMGNVDPAVAGKFNSRKFDLPLPNSLALSEVKRARYPLNFLPPEFVKQKPDYYPFIITGLAAASLLFFLLTGVVSYYKDWSTLHSIEAKRASLRTREAGMLEVRRKLESLQGDRKILLDFLGRSNVAVKAMKELSEALPKDAWLVSFSADEKGKIEIEGFTKKTSDLVVAIEKSKAFKNISFAAPIIAKDGQERFSLKLEANAR
jgi:hypothetical protein